MKEKKLNKKIQYFSKLSVLDFLKEIKIPASGLDKKQITESRINYGSNVLIGSKNNSFSAILKRSFFNFFSIILFILATISFFTEFFFPGNSQGSYSTLIIILSMVLISGIIRCIQELHSRKITNSLIDFLDSSSKVYRDGSWQQVPSFELVTGDLVSLKAGDRVPADLRIIKADNCFVSQSVITGESYVQEKSTDALENTPARISEYKNCLFLGSTVTSGECEGVVIAVGENSIYGKISLDNQNSKKDFDKGANSISWVLIRFMLLLVPIVFISSVITKGNWLTAFLFALSVAIGLTPELLPIVITACLAKGSFNMKKKQTIVKNVNAMQGFGNIDTLCVDKTGTLTGDKLILEYYMDIFGNENRNVLDLAYLTSFYHNGINNHLDNAILQTSQWPDMSEYYNSLTSNYRKFKEVPFDYSRKISSVILEKIKEKSFVLVTKGNPENILDLCSFVEYKGVKHKITTDKIQDSKIILNDMLEDGMKILAIAKKDFSKHLKESENIPPDLEEDLTLVGYIAFFDAPKKSAAEAIQKLKALNVNIKVLTGDNRDTAVSVCKRLGIDTSKVINGQDFDCLTDDEILSCVENTTIFAELNPKQKAKIVALLKTNGHKVGFLGDGMNDIPAILKADVGISVDTAAPSVKDIADVVLLKKDLGMLEEGILEGRKAFANMTKYIKITSSSNLGNIFAVIIASVLLPFFPMTSVQLLLLNLLYDILCLALPWDSVDEDLYKKPLDWSGKNLSRFMLFFAPISSIFDIITFLFLAFVLCPIMCGNQFINLAQEGQAYFISLFQSGWFLESMWTQILIIHLLRTNKLNINKNRPSKPVLLVTLIGIISFTVLIITPLGKLLGFTRLPGFYFVFLVFIVLFYLLVMTLAKKSYIKRNHSLI